MRSGKAEVSSRYTTDFPAIYIFKRYRRLRAGKLKDLNYRTTCKKNLIEKDDFIASVCDALYKWYLLLVYERLHVYVLSLANFRRVVCALLYVMYFYLPDRGSDFVGIAAVPCELRFRSC